MSDQGCRWIRQPVLVGLLIHPVRGTWLLDTGLHPRLWQQGLATRLFLYGSQMHLSESPRPRVEGIFLSHFHLDHGAGLLDFPGVPLATSRAGYEWAVTGANLRHGWCRGLMPANLAARTRWLEELPQVQNGPVRGGDFFGDGSVLAVPLPGHALGQYGLLCETEQGRIFFVADAAGHSHVLTQGCRQRLPTLIAYNRRAERQTQDFLRSLVGWCWLVPSHCPLAYRTGPLTREP